MRRIFINLLVINTFFWAVPGSQSTDTQGLVGLTQMLRPRFTVGTVMPRYTLKERMAHYGVPAVAIGVIRGGELVHAEGFGVLQAGADTPVDSDTLFSAGSVSKIATAALILKLHADAKLNIDADIRRYLKSWPWPSYEKQADIPVSLRMLLSHTGGFNLHGFSDFMPGAQLPTVYDTLNGTGPSQDEPLTLLFKPGKRYKYSGGGYTLAQLVATDILNTSFPAAAKAELFDVVGMRRSNFTNPLPDSTTNVAKAHDRDGTPVALPRGYQAMPEMAASGLWTSAHDLGQLVAALIRSYQTEGAFLPQSLAIDMMTQIAPSEHGLGPRLEGMGRNRFFHHAGSNDSYKTWMEGHLATGDGLVVLTNGTKGDDLFIEIRNAAADAFGWTINQPVFLPEVTVPDAMTESFLGTYAPDTGFPLEERQQLIGWIYDAPITVHQNDGALTVSFGKSARKHALVPSAPNRFLLPVLTPRAGVTELVFHRDSHSKVQSVTLESSGVRSFYTRTSKN